MLVTFAVSSNQLEDLKAIICKPGFGCFGFGVCNISFGFHGNRFVIEIGNKGLNLILIFGFMVVNGWFGLSLFLGFLHLFAILALRLSTNLHFFCSISNIVALTIAVLPI